MIMYLHRGNSRGWVELKEHTKPRQDDFNLVIFKINDVVYHKWSENFEKALMWEKLKK